MPEMVEVESYRCLAACTVGWRVAGVDVVDPRVVGDLEPGALDRALTGQVVSAARRRGKLLLLDLEPAAAPVPAAGPVASPVSRARQKGAPAPTVPSAVGAGSTVGLRFGMTGALALDGRWAVDQLLHAPTRRDDEDRWVRFVLRLTDPAAGAHRLVLHDPRRLGRVVLHPDEHALGPDAASLTAAELAAALSAGRQPSGAVGSSGAGGSGGPALKARLMDQARVAGIGNLIADEVLWRAGLSPLRCAGALSDAERRRLLQHLRKTLADLTAGGGSHTGHLMLQRRVGGLCPRDETPLVRSTVGGRTTWWCPAHQH